MVRARALPAMGRILLAAIALAYCSSAAAQTVWSGFEVQFSKSDFADETQPENQDRITDQVWITRGTVQGIFNAADETTYTPFASPSDTRWATELQNPGQSVAATNWQALTFTDWQSAYGGMFELATNTVLFPAVVHLVTDDIYLDLQFTTWTQGSGGGFTYLRAHGDLPSGPTGDYNLDGVVDAADYTAWRDTLGQGVDPPGAGADGDESGVIDEGDFLFWKERFGTLVSGSAAVAAVPEPSAVVLAVLGVAFIGVRRTRTIALTHYSPTRS